jgi:hypothetical protein
MKIIFPVLLSFENIMLRTVIGPNRDNGTDGKY